MPPYSLYKKTAEKLADISGDIVRSYFRSNLSVLDKNDSSPVTEADRLSEKAIRTVIESEFPSHGILGEEYGHKNLDAEYIWVIDPIDGTKSFATGKPLFCTLISLCRDKIPILGIIDQPILNDRWTGINNEPTIHNGKEISTRSCRQISDSWLSATSPDMFQNNDKIAFNKLTKAAKYTTYGGDSYTYGLLALGFSDIICEAMLKPYDYCALVPIVKGAGGKISDWAGNPLNMNSDGKVIATGDAALHQDVINILSD